MARTVRDVNRRFADTVAGAILRSGKTQHWVAQEAGIPETTLRRRLQGASGFSADELARIAWALHLQFSDLIPEGLDSEAAA